MFISLVLFLSLLAVALCALAGPRAICENGPLVGTYQISQSGFKYKAFRGIPFAKPPVGKYRFKEAERLKNKWIGEWNAQSVGSACLQLDHIQRSYFKNGSFTFHQVGDEDCLYLNVYTREGGPPKKDILFAIHGGAFMFGSGEMYDPNTIMDRDDIILVSPNYRVGPLGFLTTGDNVVPGNNGLKDQVAALEWVNRNIENFGGDPQKVTIMGLSSGGASVDYMYLTPITKGLFQRGYSYSGTSLCSWALVKDGVEKTKKLAESLGCPTTDSVTILNCLRRRPAKKIVEEVRSMMVFLYNPFTIFGPVIEVNSSRPIIEQHPRDIIKNKRYQKLPWLNGVTTEEGLYPAAGKYTVSTNVTGDFVSREFILNFIDKEWEKVGPSLLFINPKLSAKDVKKVLYNVRREYFGDKPITKENRSDLIKLLSDRLFKAGIVESVTLRENTYLYVYGHQGAISAAHELSGVVDDYGAAHGDDIFMLFRFDSSNYNPRDQQMTKVLENILYTFVLEGKVPQDLKWKPWSESKKVLVIKSPEDISTTDEYIIDLNKQKKLFKEFESGRDEL